MRIRKLATCRIGSSKFFRQRLINSSDEEIAEHLIRLDAESKEFKHELFKISWYMRGGVGMEELLHIYSHEDRAMINSIINDNIKTTIEARMPLL
jgi:hypothetical protein